MSVLIMFTLFNIFLFFDVFMRRKHNKDIFKHRFIYVLNSVDFDEEFIKNFENDYPETYKMIEPILRASNLKITNIDRFSNSDKKQDSTNKDELLKEMKRIVYSSDNRSLDLLLWYISLCILFAEYKRPIFLKKDKEFNKEFNKEYITKKSKEILKDEDISELCLA